MQAAQSINFSRRGFLGASAAMGAGLAVTAPVKLAYANPNPPLVRPREQAWNALAKAIRGPVLRPGDADFSWLTVPNNLRYSGTLPQGVARCTSAEDIAAALGWAREQGIPLVVRSGGHSYAGFSTTNGLMIDTTKMKSVELNPDGTVTLGGGALNQDLYDKLRANNLAITHGRCPTVGAAGFLLGGGIGFSMRMNGYASDSLASTHIVLADGSQVDADANNHTDLFWACRGGGGGNFGVNTSFTVKTFVPGPTVGFRYQWNGLTPDLAVAIASQVMTDFSGSNDDYLGSRMSIQATRPIVTGAGPQLAINLVGQYQGKGGETYQALCSKVAGYAAKACAIVPPNPDIFLQQTPSWPDGSYWAVQHFLDDFQAPLYFQEHSRFVVQKSFNRDKVALGVKTLMNWPGTSGFADLRFFQTGGRTNRVQPTDTAFVHRDSDWLMVIGLYWNQYDYRDTGLVEKNLDWSKEFYETMLTALGRTARGAYQNFIDGSLADWQQSYYGLNFSRLAAIKKRFDPKGVFKFPQAV